MGRRAGRHCSRVLLPTGGGHWRGGARRDGLQPLRGHRRSGARRMASGLYWLESAGYHAAGRGAPPLCCQCAEPRACSAQSLMVRVQKASGCNSCMQQHGRACDGPTRGYEIKAPPHKGPNMGCAPLCRGVCLACHGCLRWRCQLGIRAESLAFVLVGSSTVLSRRAHSIGLGVHWICW